MKRKHWRMLFVGLGMAALGLSAGLILLALDENLVFFHDPSALRGKSVAADQRLRIGGLVEEGSVVRSAAGVRFNVTDGAHAVPVAYGGLLPDLFREGQGVVAEGYMRGGVFEAEDILARHDENYMPREVAEALKAAGAWRGEGGEGGEAAAGGRAE